MGDGDGTPRLYQVDPSGTYFSWKATAIGKNYVNAKNFLEKRYTEDMELEDAIHTAKIFKGYVRDVKPDGQVEVKAGFSISNIELDPTRKVLKTTGWAESTWTDNRLTWNPAEHGGIDRLNVHHHHIWLPDMTLYNMVGLMTHLVETNAIIMSSGLILNFPYISFETHCDVNYQNWPWGMQNCTYT